MPSTNSLVAKLRSIYPDLTFYQGTSTHWSHATRTISYTPETPPAELLHELGHAISRHASYDRDVKLITMEREAWTVAQEIAPQYGMAIANGIIEDYMDTYRDWLHARSLCPNCQTNGIQIAARTYECPACRTKWSVNEARACRLRRRTL